MPQTKEEKAAKQKEYRKKNKEKIAAKRKEYGLAFYGNIVIALVAGGYCWWARAKGLNSIDIITGPILMAGVFGILMAFMKKGRLYYLGVNIPVMLCGVSMMIWDTISIVVLNACLALIIGGIATACIQTIQIKASERINAAN